MSTEEALRQIPSLMVLGSAFVAFSVTWGFLFLFGKNYKPQARTQLSLDLAFSAAFLFLGGLIQILLFKVFIGLLGLMFLIIGISVFRKDGRLPAAYIAPIPNGFQKILP